MPKGYLDGSILSTWGMIITTVACFLLFLLLLGLAYIFLKPKREQIKEKFLETKKKLVWSGIIEDHVI